ncbi:MAG: hypothetical protein KDI06_04100 [Calditrichaeota bacterium]|nr:hypothetical protein [Calditrichota bacterium]
MKMSIPFLKKETAAPVPEDKKQEILGEEQPQDPPRKGLFKKTPAQPYQISLYDEGNHVYVSVTLVREGEIDILATERYRIGRAGDVDGLSSYDEEAGDATLDLTEAANQMDINDDIGLEDDEESTAGLRSLLDRFMTSKTQINITLGTPRVSYLHYDTTWSLSGKSLRERVLAEITTTKPYLEALTSDEFDLVDLANGGIAVAVREGESGAIQLLNKTRKGILKRISRIESAEVSLINLIRSTYRFKENTVSTVVYVGHDTARIIFLRGNAILKISDPMEAYLDPEMLSTAIFRGIAKEVKANELPTPVNILLTGEAYDAGILEFLRPKFPEQVRIGYLNTKLFGKKGGDPIISQFAVPLGTGIQAQVPEPAVAYIPMDLVPNHISNLRKRFKLGAVGWMLMLLIPLSVGYLGMELHQQSATLGELEHRIAQREADVTSLEAVQEMVDKQRLRLTQYESATKILAAMEVEREPWSNFLETLTKVYRETGRIWITEVIYTQQNLVQIKGFSLSRDRIVAFVRGMENTRLIEVKSQDIREKEVFQFELEAIIPE